jgi:hypothetical protein
MKIISKLILLFFVISILNANEQIPRLETVVEPLNPFEEDDIGAMCSLGCAMGWDVVASSSLKPQGENTYDASNLSNGKLKNAWVEGKNDYGVGETITFKFTEPYFKEAKIEKVSFWGFRIVNGYTKDQIVWDLNSRVKTFSMYLNDKLIAYIDLKDTWMLQEVTFFDKIEMIYLKPGDMVKMRIESTFPGKKYKDTAISLLEPLGAH